MKKKNFKHTACVVYGYGSCADHIYHSNGKNRR